MRAALISRQGTTFDLVEAELDSPRDEEVIVRIAGVGICHTDVAAAEQQLPIPLPVVLGHEGAGVVVRVGAAVTKVAPGDHVVLSFASCAACGNCHGGQPGYCTHWVELNMACARPDGSSGIHVNGEPVGSFYFGQSSFADYALANQRNVIKIDPEVPIELMGPLGCGLQTGAGAIMRSMAVRSGSSLLVTGGGAVGLAGVMGAVIRGCKTIIVSEPHFARRQLAMTLGATHCIDPTEVDLAEAVLAIAPTGVDYVFDTTARPDVIAKAADAVATFGTIGLVGVPADPTTNLSLNMLNLLGRGMSVRGIIMGDSDPDMFIPELVAYYKSGRFPLDRLVRTYPLANINRAIEDQLNGLCVKPVLIPGESL